MLKTVLGSVFKKPATSQYPFVKTEMPANFRGRIKFIPENCIGCKLCMRDCPANAIFIRKVADKVFEADIYSNRCVYCAQCVETCPKKALEATRDFELAQLDPAKLKVIHRAAPSDNTPKTA
jgi:formate hydrogenlyase subunit 6/NADH:ubiquinone oxidoreductase subunit I